VVAAVTVVAAIVAIVMAGSGQGGIAEPAAQVSVVGPLLPELTDPVADSAVGQALPTLSGVDLNGQPISIGPDDGPMAIVVLAHWCAHCQAELPEIVRFIEQGRVPAGVSVVGLSTAIDPVRPNYPPSAWFEREAWRQPTLIDDAESLALGALGLRSFPGFVFVDGEGRVALRLTGEIGAQQFGNALDSLRP
jgi:cytochrome c biogenesis protein CcmG, thiol:disulfide interchange protein DsbE